MEAKYTPGPWRVTDEGHGLEVETKRSPRPGDRIAKLSGGDQTRRFSDAEVAANARLIAAAPELLAALKALYEHVPPPTKKSETALALAIVEASLAIKKAEGAA